MTSRVVDKIADCIQHIEIEDQTAPVRDGTKIGIRIYRPIKTQPNSILYLKAHGGGKRSYLQSGSGVLAES